MSDATHGHGTTLTGGSSGALGNIISITGPNMVRDALDVSTMDSTNKAREFIAGMRDAGEVSVELNYDGSAAGNANVIDTAFKSGTAETWTIAFPDTAYLYCLQL